MAEWAGRRLFLTGGTGFIGANLARRLVEAGTRVFALVRPGSAAWRLAGIRDRITFLEGDVASEADVLGSVEAARPEILFHLATSRAGETQGNIPVLFSTDTQGASHLILAANRAGVRRIVVAGSSLEYGDAASPHAESDPPRPTSLRGMVKASATLLFQNAARQTGLPAVILRLFHVYGPWESATRLVPSAFRAALNGGDLGLTEPGIQHDFVYVDDVVEAFLLAARGSDLAGQVINVGSGLQTTNEGLVEAVARVTGKPIAARFGIHPKGPYDARFRVADNRKAAALLGWRPRHDLLAGLRATHDWMRTGNARSYPDP